MFDVLLSSIMADTKIDVGNVNTDVSTYIKVNSSSNLKIDSMETSGCLVEDIDLETLKGSINITGHENFVYIGAGVKLNNTKIQIKGRARS